MSQKMKPVTGADLCAYTDGELDSVRRVEVEAYIAEHPDAAEEVQQYKKIEQDLHGLFDGVLNEPIPENLIPTSELVPGKSWLSTHFRAAAMISGMIVSVAIGWYMNDYLSVDSTTIIANATDSHTRTYNNLIQPAAFAHTVYSSDKRRPVEIWGEEKNDLNKWVSNRMKADIEAPELTGQGFELVGGRLLPSTNRMAAQFMYQNDDNERITLYIRRGVWDNKEKVHKYMEQDDVGTFYWIDGPMGYAVSGSVQKDQLIAVAKAVLNTLM